MTLSPEMIAKYPELIPTVTVGREIEQRITTQVRTAYIEFTQPQLEALHQFLVGGGRNESSWENVGGIKLNGINTAVVAALRLISPCDY